MSHLQGIEQKCDENLPSLVLKKQHFWLTWIATIFVSLEWHETSCSQVFIDVSVVFGLL